MMTVQQAISRLQDLLRRNGDINVEADCPFCGKTFDCSVIVVAPEVARLKATENATVKEMLDR